MSHSTLPEWPSYSSPPSTAVNIVDFSHRLKEPEGDVTHRWVMHPSGRYVCVPNQPHAPSPPIIDPTDANATCRYTSKRCTLPRTVKRNGELHSFCELHRMKANENQRRLETKKKLQKLQSQGGKSDLKADLSVHRPLDDKRSAHQPSGEATRSLSRHYMPTTYASPCHYEYHSTYMGSRAVGEPYALVASSSSTYIPTTIMSQPPNELPPHSQYFSCHEVGQSNAVSPPHYPNEWQIDGDLYA